MLPHRNVWISSRSQWQWAWLILGSIVSANEITLKSMPRTNSCLLLFKMGSLFGRKKIRVLIQTGRWNASKSILLSFASSWHGQRRPSRSLLCPICCTVWEIEARMVVTATIMQRWTQIMQYPLLSESVRWWTENCHLMHARFRWPRAFFFTCSQTLGEKFAALLLLKCWGRGTE